MNKINEDTDVFLENIVNDSETSDAEKIANLYEYAQHLSAIYDEVCDSGKNLRLFESVIRWRRKDGYFLKIDQMGDEFKATFWKPDGDGVEAHSEKSADLVEAVENCGIGIGARKAIEIIRKGYEANGLQLRGE